MVQDRTRANARSDCGRPFPFPLADLTSLNDYEVIISSYLTGRNHQNVKQIQTTLLMDESFWGRTKHWWRQMQEKQEYILTFITHTTTESKPSNLLWVMVTKYIDLKIYIAANRKLWKCKDSNNCLSEPHKVPTGAIVQANYCASPT